MVKPIIIQPAEGTVRIEVMDYSSIISDCAGLLVFSLIVGAFLWVIVTGRKRRDPK